LNKSSRADQVIFSAKPLAPLTGGFGHTNSMSKKEVDNNSNWQSLETQSMPIYVSDYRIKTLVAFAAFFALSVLLTLYAIFLSGDILDWLRILIYPYVTAATVGVFHFQYSKRFEFYKSFLRVATGKGNVTDIPYSELQIVKLNWNSGQISSILIAPRNEPITKRNTMRISNASIKKMRATVYDLIIGEITGGVLVENMQRDAEASSAEIKAVAEKTKSFVLIAGLASIPFFLGGYLLYQLFSSNYSEPVFPIASLNELVILSLLGFGLLIISVLYLRRIARSLATINQKWFGPIPKTLLICIVLLAGTLALSIVSIYELPISNNPSGSVGLVAIELTVFSLTGLLILIGFFGIGIGTLASRAGPFKGRVALILCLVLICFALASPIVGALAGIDSTPISGAKVVVTYIVLNISYPHNAPYGYLGNNHQIINWAGGGNATLYGGEHWNTWIALYYQLVPNGDQITSFVTTTKGFSVNSVSPRLPFYAPAGSELNVSYVLAAPLFNYAGPLSLEINTT
jgi:hypothetical protein